MRVSFASAISTNDAPLEDSQSSFASPTASCSRLLVSYAKDFNVGVAESGSSERFEDVICERDSLDRTLSNIRVRFQKAGHEICAAK